MRRDRDANPRVQRGKRGGWFPLLILAFGALAFSCAAAGSLIPNSTFVDEDGDGKVDGWEVKTFLLEKDPNDPKKCRLTLKIKQDSERQIVGEITTTFQGPEGFYQITVRYLDENDGISMGKLLVNGKTVHIWDFDNIFFSYFRNEVIENVRLKPGDKITVWAANDGTEYCRLDSVRVVPSPRPPTAREIEEMKPPEVADALFGDLVPLGEFRDLSADETRPETHVSIGRGSLIFPARAGEKFVLELIPNNTRVKALEKGQLLFLGATATGLEGGAATTADLEIPYDPELKTGNASFSTPSDGLYRFDFRMATAFLKTPHVFACAPLAKGPPMLIAWGDFFFFVPKGTKSFAVTASALGNRSTDVTLLTPKGTVCKRASLEAKEELAVRVPEGQDGVWLLSVRGINPGLTLRGVPPFLATHPKYLLVPKECVAPKK